MIGERESWQDLQKLLQKQLEKEPLVLLDFAALQNRGATWNNEVKSPLPWRLPMNSMTHGQGNTLKENRNEGTFGCSLVPKTGTRAHSPKPPFYKTGLLFFLEKKPQNLLSGFFGVRFNSW